ncbi:hypothetical protein J7T55_001465 [Diaporthe amygdali]|uniref:uncharacterized protein n=1 Tax=Phomopsis amygdali TaxID=1214568 RepID=UPI0022FF0C3A|nr:uncharacterized protein J7T55_001465 [Diaporthe amygdali]KAJ0115056.1 hypothetical protein J7T55_001465 [Diaporthe amygdali]
MQPSYINAVLAFVASVSAAPVLEARTYPTVATYEVTLGEVDPAYQAQLDSAVVNLDEPANIKRDVEVRQTGTCDLQGFAIVNGQISSFAGTVQNSPANYGRAVTLTGILAGCSIGLVPQQNCALWSIIDTSGCATARSVTFSN